MTTIFRIPTQVGGTKVLDHAGGTRRRLRVLFHHRCGRMHAIEKSLARLRANGLEIREVLEPAYVLEVSEGRMYVEANWPEQADSLVTQAEFEQLVGDGGVVFGPFAGYNPQPGRFLSSQSMQNEQYLPDQAPTHVRLTDWR